MAPIAAGYEPVDFHPSRYTQPRLTNKQWVAGIIRSSGGISRSDLALRTGISKSGVAALVGELLADRLVDEVFEGGRTHDLERRRRSATLRAVLPDVLIGTIQFDHEGITVVIADMTCEPLGRAFAEARINTAPGPLFETAAGLLRGLLSTLERPEPLDAVVVALPGPIDKATGRVRSPSVLSAWSDTDPAEELGRRLGIPVHIDNDADLGAWGEFVEGAGRPFSDFLYVEASRGIGAGLVLDGAVYRGSAGIAGEIGHNQVDPAGPLCRCGQNGCIEVVASSGPVLAKLRAIRDDHAGALALHDFVDGVSARVLREAGHTLGRVLAEACNLLNPQAIVIGGQLGSAHESYLEGIREAIRRYAQPVIADGLVVVAAGLGESSALTGSLIRARHLVFDHEFRLELGGTSLPRKAHGEVTVDTGTRAAGALV